jgi:hypothetical protein
MENTVKREADLQSPKAKEDFEKATAKGKDDMEKIKAAGIQPGQMLPRAPQAPEGALRPFDVLDAVGFAVCGEDKAWHWVKGKVITNNKVELTCDKVSAPHRRALRMGRQSGVQSLQQRRPARDTLPHG